MNLSPVTRACGVELYNERVKEEQARYTARKRMIITGAKNVPCMDCGIRYPSYVMDFDHRDPSTKRFSIGRQVASYGIDALRAEIAKCDVVCANCHRIRTYAPTN